MTWIENIQTLSKYSQQSREVSFTLIGRNLEWNRGFHSDLLRDNYGLPGNVATVLRHYLPRGAAVEDIEDGYIVEASEELRPYASEIANQLNINPMRIGFDNVHYEVRTEPQWAFDNIEGWLVYEEDEEVSDKILSFVKAYLPNIYAAVQHFDRAEETVASAKKIMIPMTTWFQKVCSHMKTAQDCLSGEWWIIDGFVEYADGDIGDTNHDGVVYNHVFGVISDIEVDSDVENIVLAGGLTEEQQENIDESYPGLFSLYQGDLDQYNSESAKWDRIVDDNWHMDEMKALQESMPGFIEYGGQPKDYAVEHLGWIRVLGANFEAQHVTENTMQQIMSFIHSECDETILDSAEIHINEHATGNYIGVTIGELQENVNAGIAAAKYHRRARLEKGGLY